MSIWPSAISTDADLYVAVDFPNSVTALNGALNSVNTVINVSSTVNYPSSGGFVLIDSELIKFTGTAVGQLTGCSRGYDGTMAASHLNNAVVNMVSMAEHHNVLKDEVIALETSLNFSINKALISNASGRADVSSTTNTELGYVSGVTSSIQSQLNAKIDTAGTGLSKIGTTLNLSVPVSTSNGGTGQITYTDGQLLIGNSSGNTLTKSTLTGTTNQIIITNGNGSITLSTPQNIATTSSPIFQQMTVGSMTPGGITFNDTEVSPNTVSVEAPATISSSYTLKLPIAQGAASSVLQNDGAGNLSWVIGGGSGVTSITGTTNQIIASSSTGAVTLSTPQDIATISSPSFASLTLTQSADVNANITAIGAHNVFVNLTANSQTMRMFVSAGTFAIQNVADGIYPLYYSIGSNHVVIGEGNATEILLNASTLPGSATGLIDNSYDLGSSSANWRNVYLKTGLVLQQTGVGTNAITISSPSSVTSYSLIMPSAQGIGSLQNDGAGNLSWGQASTSVLAHSSTITTTTLFTPSSTGTYRVSIYIVDTAGTVFTLQGTIGWTDTAQAQTATTSVLTNTTNGYIQSSFFIEATSGNAVTYAVALTGTATYNLYVVAERLS